MLGQATLSESTSSFTDTLAQAAQESSASESSGSKAPMMKPPVAGLESARPKTGSSASSTEKKTTSTDAGGNQAGEAKPVLAATPVIALTNPMAVPQPGSELLVAQLVQPAESAANSGTSTLGNDAGHLPAKQIGSQASASPAGAAAPSLPGATFVAPARTGQATDPQAGTAPAAPYTATEAVAPRTAGLSAGLTAPVANVAASSAVAAQAVLTPGAALAPTESALTSSVDSGASPASNKATAEVAAAGMLPVAKSATSMPVSTPAPTPAKPEQAVTSQATLASPAHATASSALANLAKASPASANPVSPTHAPVGDGRIPDAQGAPAGLSTAPSVASERALSAINQPTTTTNSDTQQAAIVAAVHAAVTSSPAAASMVAASQLAVAQAATVPVDPGTGTIAGTTSRKVSSAAGDAFRTSSASLGQAARTTATLPAQTASLFPERAAAPGAKAATGAVKTGERESPAPHDAHKAETESSSPSSFAPGTSGASSSNTVATSATTLTSANPTGVNAGAVLVQPAQVTGQSAPATGSKQDGVQSAADGVATGAEVSGADAHALPAINTARVMQSMQGSEMRVGMHSAEFGNVSVSTMLNRQSIAAQISFEHMDLGKAIAAHLPSIEAKLSSEYGMHAKVEVRDQSLGSAADGGRGEDRRGSGSALSTPSSTTGFSSGSTVAESVEGLAGNSMAATLSEGARLDIRV